MSKETMANLYQPPTRLIKTIKINIRKNVRKRRLEFELAHDNGKIFFWTRDLGFLIDKIKYIIKNL